MGSGGGLGTNSAGGGADSAGGTQSGGGGESGALDSGLVDSGTLETDSGIGSDAGMDAGARDAGQTCADQLWKFCEDFEAASVGNLPMGWTVSGGGKGSISVAAGQVHGGKLSLKTVSSTPYQPRIEKSLGALGGTAETHWGRVYYRVAAPAPVLDFHLTMVALRIGGGESRVLDTVQDAAGKMAYLYNIPDDSCCNLNALAYDFRYDGIWHCTEWYVNNATDSFRFFVDGNELRSVGFSQRPEARLARFSSIALGSIFYVPASGPFEVWFDDLALNDSRIGCE
jgi:hypothetical protein